MKPFVVKPVTARSFSVDPTAPQWRYFFLAGVSYLLGASWIVTGLIAMAFHATEERHWTYLGILALWLGSAFVAIGKLVRDSHTNQIEFAKLLAEQDERIRKLEAQVAALTPPNTP
jgi:hypothetical protein